MSTPIVRTASESRKSVAAWRRQGMKVAVGSTRAPLHEGHLSLVRAAHQRADRVILPPTYARSMRTPPAGAARRQMLYAPDARKMYLEWLPPRSR